MNGLKKFFGKDDIQVFESGKKSAEQAKQKARKPKSSRWKKYLAVGASLAILGFATPLNSEDSNACTSSDNIKSNKIELASNMTVENGSVVQQTREIDYGKSMLKALGDYSDEAKTLLEKLHEEKFFENNKDKRPIKYYDERTGEIKTKERGMSERVMDNIYIMNFLRPYLELPMGRELLETAVDSGYRLQMQPPVPVKKIDGSIEYGSFGANVDGDKKTITLMWPKGFHYKNAKDHINNKYLFGTMRALGHELRHVWQCENGLSPVFSTDKIQDQIVKKRIREADASAVEAALMWQFKNQLNWEEPFQKMKQDGIKSDIAQRFEEKMSVIEHEEQAYAEAFKQWYGNPERSLPYDRQIVLGWENAGNTTKFIQGEWVKKLTIPGTETKYVKNKIYDVDKDFFKRDKNFSIPRRMKDENGFEDETYNILHNKGMSQVDLTALKFYPSENNSTGFIQRRNNASQKIASYRNKNPNLSAIIRRQKLISHRRT